MKRRSNAERREMTGKFDRNHTNDRIRTHDRKFTNDRICTMTVTRGPKHSTSIAPT